MQAACLVEHVAAALDAAGDKPAIVAMFLERLAVRGTGAEMQRTSAARRGMLTDVVDDLMELTARR